MTIREIDLTAVKLGNGATRSHTCECGCGQPAPTAKRSNLRLGVRRGDPLKYISGHNKRGTSDLTRYVVEPSGCWRWHGSYNGKGYGRVQVDREHTQAHRAIYEARHGKLPRHVHLDHLCRNPWCVNPDHLEPVSLAENNARTARLTPRQVLEIRNAHGTHTGIATRFGISRQHVADIRSGRRRGSVAVQP